MKIRTIAIAGMLAGLMNPAWGTAINGTGLQTVLDDITVAPVAGDSSVDVDSDQIDDANDTFWAITGAGGSISTVIIEIASFADSNAFGVYDPVSGNSVELFAGAAGAGDQVALGIAANGEVKINFAGTGIFFAGNRFGFYLDVTELDPDEIWYSDTALNSDGQDHMVAFQGTNTDTIQVPGAAAGLWTDNEFILAWEDLRGPLGPDSDRDFTDFVLIVESVLPVPEPASLALLGMGLIGFGASRRRQVA